MRTDTREILKHVIFEFKAKKGVLERALIGSAKNGVFYQVYMNQMEMVKGVIGWAEEQINELNKEFGDDFSEDIRSDGGE